jgi:uncharacterized repeat protein (TIGR03803 family)
MSPNRPFLRSAGWWLRLAILFLFVVIAARIFAQTNYQVVRSFGAPGSGDAATPLAWLTLGRDGAFYGTTFAGGTNNSGSVFKINPDGSNYAVLHSFGVTDDGDHPYASVFMASDGVLYGTTSFGGNGTTNGIVYRLNSDGTGYSILHNFLGGTNDGTIPDAAPVEGADGALYGTVSRGMPINAGIVYRINRDGSDYSILHSFGGSGDGELPQGMLVPGTDGMLYGTTYLGGTGSGGTVFRLRTNGTGYQVLKSFVGPDGYYPGTGLIQGSDGVLYGTALFGGTPGVTNGVVFKLNSDGSGFAVLRNFLQTGGDGRHPGAPVAQGADGVLYGTTYDGGLNGGGTVFKINTDGTGYATLYNFTGGLDGGNTQAAVVPMPDGSLYGTTYNGGTAGGGTIFKLYSQGMVTIALQVVGNGMQLNFSGGIPGQSYNVEATTILGSPSGWQPLGSVQAGANGQFQFLDSTMQNMPVRFYRASAPSQ